MSGRTCHGVEWHVGLISMNRHIPCVHVTSTSHSLSIGYFSHLWVYLPGYKPTQLSCREMLLELRKDSQNSLKMIFEVHLSLGPGVSKAGARLSPVDWNSY
jgi:hypothetical protein